jgi:hypothetical protein
MFSFVEARGKQNKTKQQTTRKNKITKVMKIKGGLLGSKSGGKRGRRRQGDKLYQRG